MFTGLIEGIGTVVENREGGLKVRPPVRMKGFRIGESVSVNGVCLTVTSRKGGVAFDVSQETRSVTTLGGLKKEDRVNLERSLRLGDRFGGHMVSGHVDATARVSKIEPMEEGKRFRFEASKEPVLQMVERGSIAVDGVSLTITRLLRKEFEVCLIPHTLKETTFGKMKVGDRVNLELDMIGKWVRTLVEPYRADPRFEA